MLMMMSMETNLIKRNGSSIQKRKSSFLTRIRDSLSTCLNGFRLSLIYFKSITMTLFGWEAASGHASLLSRQCLHALRNAHSGSTPMLALYPYQHASLRSFGANAWSPCAEGRKNCFFLDPDTCQCSSLQATAPPTSQRLQRCPGT